MVNKAGLEALAAESFCYVTTAGRMTGHPHEIEIWFGIEGRTLYMLSGGGRKSDWVKNIMQNPAVAVRIATQELRGKGRIVSEAGEDALARRLLLDKSAASYSGDLTDWGRTALPVAIDLDL